LRGTIEQLVVSRIQKPLVAADGCLRDYFKDATGGDFYKASIIDFGGSRAAFRQVRRDGNCRSAHLVSETELLHRRESCVLVDKGGRQRQWPRSKCQAFQS